MSSYRHILIWLLVSLVQFKKGKHHKQPQRPQKGATTDERKIVGGHVGSKTKVFGSNIKSLCLADELPKRRL